MADASPPQRPPEGSPPAAARVDAPAERAVRSQRRWAAMIGGAGLALLAALAVDLLLIGAFGLFLMAAAAWACFMVGTYLALRAPPEPAPVSIPVAPQPVQSSLQDLAALIDSLPEAALLIDREGRVAAANAEARRQLRFNAAGLRLSAVLRQPEVLDAVEAAAVDGATSAVEYETASQFEEHFRVYVSPIVWGEQRGALAIFTDRTAMINSERMRADFLANASHELKTPVASLSLLIETVSGPARGDSAAQERFLGMMRVEIDRMRRLIDDLLSLSKIELNEHVPPSGRADLGAVVKEACDALAPLSRERGVEVRLELPGAPVAVVGERHQLAQVAKNLIENAVKYTPAHGTVSVEIGQADGREAAVAQAGRRWSEAGNVALLTPPARVAVAGFAYVRVVDQGPGIARRHLPRLGERFYRVERTDGADRGGTGLGLAIVKHIVNRHRGGLLVESEVGRGSAFAAYFERATTPAPTPSRLEGPVGGGTVGGGTVGGGAVSS